MKLPRRTVLQFAGGAAVGSVCSRIATAQTYPTRAITLIISFTAGGSADAVGRIVAEGMRRSLGQLIIIENITGAEAWRTIAIHWLRRTRPAKASPPTRLSDLLPE